MSSSSSSGEANEKASSSSSAAILSPNVSSSSSNVLQATSQPVSQAQAEDAAKVPEVRQVFEIVYNELALRFPDEQFKDFRFPPDDVVIEKYLKQHRTNQARLPPLKTKSGGERLDPYVKVCYQCFSADWKLVKTQYTRYFRFQPPKTVFELAPEKYFCRTLEECFKASVTPLGYADQSSQTPRSSRNAPNSRTSMQITRNRAASSQGLNEAAQQLSLRPDDPHFQYVQPWTPRTDEENRREREQFRLGVFDYYDPDYDWKPGTEISICNRIRMTRKPGESKKTKLPFYFKFQPIKITMELGDYEPFFCTVALYDIGSKKKISENFDFNCNPEHLNAIVAGQILPEEVLCESKTALFAVTKRNKNIFMLVEIFKVLHGDNEVSVDPYAKIKEKEGLKADKFRNIIRTEATDYCQRLGRYRQLFGWTAIQVFDIKGSLVSEGPTQFKQVFQRNPRDEPIEFLTAFSTKDTKKMGKELFGTLDVNLEKVEQEQLSQLHCLDPSLQPVIKHEDQPPAESTSSSSSSSSSSSALGSPPVEGGKKKRTKTKQPKLKDLIVEVHEFPQDPNLVPNFFYVNNMYIYPTYLNFNSRNARNIAIKMQVKASDVLSDPPLNCIYTSRGFVSEYLMPVQYHNKTPQFHDEIKIALPPQLSESHHLVFTFYHINCQTKKKKEEVAETEIASGFVPLYPDGRIVVHNQGNHHAIALTGKLEDGYLSKPVHLIDGGKQLFQMYFSLVSTIYPEDASISKFLHVYHTSEDEVSDESLIAALNDLRGLSEVLAVQYLPVIINNLLEVMTRRSNQPSQEAFKSLIAILHKVKTNKVGLNDKLRRASLLELYSSHVFDQTFETRKPVYYPLCQNFLLYMMEKNLNGGEEDSIFVNSWFIFDLIIKSMTLELVDNGKLNTPNRVDILNADNSDNFTKLLFRVLNNLTRYFQKQISLGKIDDIRILNQNLALFIKDLFTIFDRGVVIDLIKAYLKEMNKMSSDLVEVNTSFKFEFLQIIYDHEHLVALNLPLNSLESFDADAFDYNHPLSSVIINETINTMILNSSKASKNAVEVLYDVVVKIAYDARYAETDKRERVTATFFSLVRQLLENWSQLSGWRESTIAPNKRELYALLIYILKSSSRELVRRWWKQESNTNVLLFLRLFIDCIRTFEYNPKHIRPAKITLTPAVALFMTEVGTQEVTNMLKEIRTVVRNPEDEDHRLRALSQEVSLLILDLLEDFMVDYNTTISDHSQKDPIMDGIIDVYLTYLSSHQSIRFVHSLYASLRSFAHKYSNVLFHGNNSYVGDLCSRLLLHCNIPDPRLNIEASSLIYILLKLNQKETQSFGRTRIQLITSLSKLVNDNEIKEDVSLNLSFQRITQYALHSYSMLNHRDIDQDPHYENDDSHASYSHARFCRGIEGLSKTLSNILRDTLQLNELKQSADNHMIADLYKQIAEGYKNTPDLRVTWLRQLAKFQDSQHNYAEAAICNCHISALIADYLVHKEQLPIDLSIFTSIAPFISEFADDGDEGVCQSQDFTTEGFKSAVNSAINFFRLAELFEFAAQLYKVITPLYERDHSYKDLSNAFKQLKKFWAAVVNENEHRLFGRYFRIGFYGRQFGEDIDGTEFVYKEPKLTHLLELSEKIKTFYTFKFNSPIQIIDSSANISALDPSQCCIQITYVDPFFDDPENRTTFFSKNNGLVSFYFDTPFTKSGKAQGSVADQFMRKTVLSVQESFPNMVTRLPVQSRREIITTPIENAINNVEKRCLQIEAELANTPINHKTLQQILQGSVRLQVNEGAISICKVFLVNFLENPRCHIEALCFTLRRFLDLCRKALAEDLKLTDTLQMPFHQEMEAGFAELKYELERYLSEVNLDAFAQEESGTFSESFNEQDEDTVTDFDDNAHDDSEPSTSPSFSSAISSASSSSDVLSFPSEKRARSSSAKEASSSSSSSLASELSPKPRRKKTPLDHIKEEEGGAGSLSPKKRPRSTYLKKSGEDSATSSSEALPVASESTKRKHRQSLEGKVAPVAAPIASSSSLRASQPIPPPIIPPPAASAPLNSPIVAAAIASAPIPMPIMEITSPSPRKPLETFKDTGPRAPQSPTISLSLTRLSSPSLDEEANKEQSGSVSPGSGLPKPRDTPPEAPKSPKKRPQPPPPSVAPPAYVLANRRPVGSDSSSASSSPSTSPAAVPAPKPKEDEDGEF